MSSIFNRNSRMVQIPSFRSSTGASCQSVCAEFLYIHEPVMRYEYLYVFGINTKMNNESERSWNASFLCNFYPPLISHLPNPLQLHAV